MLNRTALTNLDACDPLPKLGEKVEQPYELTGEAAAAAIYGVELVDFEQRDHGKALGITQATCQQKKPSPWPFPSSDYIDLLDYVCQPDSTPEEKRQAAVRVLEYYSPFKFYF